MALKSINIFHFPDFSFITNTGEFQGQAVSSCAQHLTALFLVAQAPVVFLQLRPLFHPHRLISHFKGRAAGLWAVAPTPNMDSQSVPCPAAGQFV